MRLSLCKMPPSTLTTWPGGGGGLVVVDPKMGWQQSYAIPIPVHVDGSYQVELYVVWEVLRARGAHRVIWGIWGQQWSFHDSKGYIDAVQSGNPGSSPASGARAGIPRRSQAFTPCHRADVGTLANEAALRDRVVH